MEAVVVTALLLIALSIFGLAAVKIYRSNTDIGIAVTGVGLFILIMGAIAGILSAITP